MNNRPKWYSEEFERMGLSFDDQRWIQENVKAEEDNDSNVISVSGSSKHSSKAENSFVKPQLFSKLLDCNYRTPPKEIAKLLEEIFSDWKSKDGHWLYISQSYTPKSIRSVLNQMKKREDRGDLSIENPPALFTSVILRFKKKRSKTEFR